MNDYKVFYNMGTAEDGYDIVTELTESKARKFFKARHKGESIEITGVELIRENTTATKQQEREALEIIRKMVADLGPQSYLAIAFEIAEQNIEYDFGDSMKGRLESAEKKLDDAKADAQAKITALEAELRKANNGIEELIQHDDERKDAMKKMVARTLSPDDLEDVRQLLDDRATEADEAATKAADEIVKYADQPESKEFRQAVADHRNFSGTAKYYRDILERVVAAQAAAHTTTTAADVAA